MPNKVRKYFAFFDGCCEPKNPGGNMGIGAIIMDENGEVVVEHSMMIPEGELNSNNVAEYLAFIWIIEYMHGIKQGFELEIKGDAQLVIRQMNGEWKIKQGMYKRYAIHAKERLLSLLGMANWITIEWVGRDSNDRADMLSKRHLVDAGVKFELQPPETLNDDDPMPYGKHKGTPMRDIPIKYLIYMYDNSMIPARYKGVKKWIELKMEALKGQ